MQRDKNGKIAKTKRLLETTETKTLRNGAELFVDCKSKQKVN